MTGPDATVMSVFEETASLLVGRSRPLDPPDGLTRLREEDPVSRVILPDGSKGWLVTRYRDVRAILADDRFGSGRTRVLSAVRRLPEGVQEATPPGLFVAMDPPEHTRYRRALTSYFTVRRMRELTPRIERIVADQLDAMRRLPRPVDLVRAFAEPVPLLVICDLLGVPEDERAAFADRVTTVQNPRANEDDLRAARDGNRQHMLDLIRAKRRRPDDGLISTIVHGHDRDGLAFEDTELIGMCLLLLVAGHEPTVQTLSLGTYALLERPDQLRLLRERPELIDNTVEELLRYLSVHQFGVFRTAREDVEIDGRTIMAGEPVLLSLSGANRDPAQFPHADRLDVTRPPSRHLTFGHGVHQCLGQQLARMMLAAGLRGLLDRFPTLRLGVDAERIRMRVDLSVYGVHELPVDWS
jgi:cytochrome P450